jgi:cAMP phosphodiesterase
MPLSHGSNETSGTYESTAFFVRHDPSSREFLFFGDVEPDAVAKRPHTISVWLVAAPKIPQTLSTIFIECSWTSGRPDNLLYGHLSPEHLVAELNVLAKEVILARGGTTSIDVRNDSKPMRKKHKSNPISPPNLRGALRGLRIYITHCKDNLDNAYDRRISHVIVDEVKTLIEAQGLGAEILAAEQGMRIGP